VREVPEVTNARAVLDRAESEADLQAKIVAFAEMHGWHVWHDNDSRRNREGLPDLLLLRGATLLFIEVKTEKGAVSPAQRAFISRLKQVKYVDADIVRPHNFDELVDVLKAARR
jgi:Holliday junction resolvase-like predicted endonuclease